jgi:hypothetical protein
MVLPGVVARVTFAAMTEADVVIRLKMYLLERGIL